MAVIQAANLPSGARERPVPKMASTITSALSRCRSSVTSTPTFCNASSSLAAGPRSRVWSMQQTPASRPHLCRCRAAASPSPALLPTPQTTAARWPTTLAICQPAASMSHSTEMPNRSSVSASTSLTWRLVSCGRALDDKGAVGISAVDRVRLRDGRARQAGDQLWRDRADLRKLERGVAEGTVVDRYLDALDGLGLLGECARTADPGHDPAQLVVEVEALQVLLDGVCMPGRHASEDLVQGIRTAHLLDLLQHHRGQLAVALGEDRVGALGQCEEEGGPAAAAALGLADHQTVALQVGEVLADRVGGNT